MSSLVLQRTERSHHQGTNPKVIDFIQTALAELLYFMLRESVSKLWELVKYKQRSFFHP